MAYTTEFIKNVSIAGHGGTGKTTLFERLLFAGGAIGKAETVESGKTVSDSTTEEIERKISIHAAMAHVERAGKKLNFFDTPGSSDFTGDVILTFRASEFAILTVDGHVGVQIETIKLWRNLDMRKKPRGIFITRLDSERADFSKTLADIKEKFKTEPVAITLSMGNGPAYKGVIDILNGKAYLAGGDGVEKESPIPDEFKAEYEAAREKLIEAAAEGDDTLMEHYIDKGSLDAEEMHKGLIEALAENKILPVFCGAALKNSGLIPVLDFIADVGPDPHTAEDIALDAEGKQVAVPLSPEKPLAGLVIKTAYDQFSGKLSWFKIICGKLTADAEVYNVSENKKERVGKLYISQGKKLEEVKELFAGDVGIITKTATLRTNDTVTAGDLSLKFLPLRLPEPVHSVAVNAVAKKDDDKLGEYLVRAAEEDKTFKYNFNAETKETVISGMGELQINIILDKIKQNQKIEVETHVPRVAYRETITKKAGAEYTHKKQTGGHGQYGKVVMEITPLKRGENYQFVNAIFGGAIPKNFIPGIEKGVIEGMARGTMAQYPVVDVEVKIVDGKYHPVDSSELSFKLAARNAFRESMRQAGPTLLEPVMNLTVFVEDKYLGDVMSDLSGKRGKILGQDEMGGGIAEIKAEVPQAELLRYSIDLRSITSGTGSFGVAFDHYAPISGRIAEDVIKAAEAFKVQESDE
ncbi:elongation factor G [Leadbettera azotonutricia]|uniref:Elongation factor G n=1 Tax=Leadbettera azotonutricia (strain ATCC BAA-888 / DSM 13862 / ZAS-9) TaxID=545695 RepID=F5Y9U6_LEAAZ|nr:elongation factor G [Leadbettera azotonutricia]AEF80223.1 translation elongation factor G [Leadbettera azotonutricia ZAS-9]